MLWKVLVELGALPSSACIKVDDAEVGIEEGRAAGCWTASVAASGNGVGLSLADFMSLSPGDKETRVRVATAALKRVGADFVIDTVGEPPEVVEKIGRLISAGYRAGGRDLDASPEELARGD